jgi:hypothetical protein
VFCLIFVLMIAAAGGRELASSIAVTVQTCSRTFVTETAKGVRMGRGCIGRVSAPVHRQHPPWSS